MIVEMKKKNRFEWESMGGGGGEWHRSPEKNKTLIRFSILKKSVLCFSLLCFLFVKFL